MVRTVVNSKEEKGERDDNILKLSRLVEPSSRYCVHNQEGTKVETQIQCLSGVKIMSNKLNFGHG